MFQRTCKSQRLSSTLGDVYQAELMFNHAIMYNKRELEDKFVGKGVWDTGVLVSRAESLFTVSINCC